MPDKTKLDQATVEAMELANAEKCKAERSNRIEEIKEDLRLTLDIIQEMTKGYPRIDSVAWPVAIMVLFNEIRQSRSPLVYPGPWSGLEIGEPLKDVEFVDEAKDSHESNP